MNLTLVNERRHNKTYTDGEYTYKIYNMDYDKKDVFQEAFITSKVENLGLNVPIIQSVFKIEEQWTIKSDLISGDSLYTLMQNNKKNIVDYINQLVNIQINISSKKCTAIPRQKAKLQYGINDTDLDESFKLDLIDMLDSSPKHKKLCHGNLTPHNIIMNNDTYCIINWNHANQGNTSADVARTYIWFKVNMPEFADTYLDTFCEQSCTSKKYVRQWLPIVAATRLSKGNPEEHSTLLNMIEIIEY